MKKLVYTLFLSMSAIVASVAANAPTNHKTTVGFRHDKGSTQLKSQQKQVANWECTSYFAGGYWIFCCDNGTCLVYKLPKALE